MEFPLNVNVHCDDGLCGKSTFIILNPTSEQITHLVVKEKQQSGIERLVPVKYIRHTAAEVILLNCNLEIFRIQEPFNQSHFSYTDVPQYATDPKLTLLWPYVVAKKKWIGDKFRAIPPGELAIRKGARVRATDGRVGRIDQFIVDPEKHYITHLVLKEGHQWGKRVICIPINQIENIEERIVHLKINKEEVGAMQTIPC